MNQMAIGNFVMSMALGECHLHSAAAMSRTFSPAS